MFTQHMDMASLPWEECENFDDFQNLFQAFFPPWISTQCYRLYMGTSQAGQRLLLWGFFGPLKCSWTNLEQLEAPFFWLVLCQWPPVSVFLKRNLTNETAEIFQPFWWLKPKTLLFNLRIRPDHLKRQHKQNHFTCRKRPYLKIFSKCQDPSPMFKTS